MAFKGIIAALELRSVTCCVRSFGGSAETRFFGGFTTVLGMFFDGLGCFWPWRQRVDSPKAGSTEWEKGVEELGENVQAKSRRCFRFRMLQ